MSVKFIKMVTGEELVAKLEENGDDYVLTEPVRIGMTNQGIAMGIWCPFIKGDKVTLAKSNVMFTSELDEDVMNAYNSKFGSGIVIADSSILKG